LEIMAKKMMTITASRRLRSPQDGRKYKPVKAIEHM
jgi:hypothetical protein